MTSSRMVRFIHLKRAKRCHSVYFLEKSLAHLDEVNTRLAETHQELQKEVDLLQTELKSSQDPQRMSTIQEMISVRIPGLGVARACHVLTRSPL